jgi:hypothetical protein
MRLQICQACSMSEDRMTFHVRLVLPANVELHQQVWQNGVPVFAEHIRSRLRLSARFEMEAEMQPGGKTVSARLLRGTCYCDHFVAENVNGLGGDLARLLDSGSGRLFKPWQLPVLNDFQTHLTKIIATTDSSAELRSCLSNLLASANKARSNAPPPQDLPLRATPVPLWLAGSVDIEVLVPIRVRVPHAEHLLHPALGEFVIHVVHTAASASTHPHVEPAHKK